MCLTEKQTDHAYKAVEDGNMINTKTMTSETAQIQDDNPYKKVVLNKVFKEEDKSPEMRNWSIFNNNVRYVQHDQVTPQNLNIDTLDYRDHKELYLKLRGEEREMLDVDFGFYPDILKSKYLDVYKGVYAGMVYTGRFNENSDLSMTYLGQTKMMRDTKIKAEGKISYHWSRVCFRKITGWHRMSNFVRYRCYEILHVKIVLLAMQNSTCTTKVLFQYSENSSGKRTIC